MRERFETERAAFEAQLAEAEERLETVQRRLSAERDELAQQLADAEAAHEQDRAAALSKAEAGARIDGLREQLRQENAAALSKLEQRNQDQADALAEAEARIERLTATLAAERDARSEQVERAEQTQSEVRTQLAEAKQALDELQQMLSTRDDSHQASTAEYETRLVEAETALEAMRSKIQERETALQQAREQAERLRNRAAEQASEEVHDFYERFASLDAQLTDRGLLINLSGDRIRFASGSANLPADAAPSLERIAGILAEYPELDVQILGHTDSSGNPEINRGLSEQRAAAVREALVERGVASSRLRIEGLGSTQPIASNATNEGRQRNRRVELYIERQDQG